MSVEKKIWTVLDIIRWGTDFFTTKEVDSPRLTIELLLTEVLSCTRIQLYMMHDRPLTDKELAILREYCARRSKREPLQYIIGNTNFYGYTFSVNSDVLIPRPETELIIDCILQYCNANSSIKSIIDLGTGSGCIPITLSKKLDSSFTIKGIDISSDALTLARSNSIENEANVEFEQIDILKSNVNLAEIVISNPPYMTKADMLDLQPELKYEPEIALTDYSDGLVFYKRIAELLVSQKHHVKAFFLEVRAENAGNVENLYQGIANKIHVVKDYSGIERIVWGELD